MNDKEAEEIIDDILMKILNGEIPEDEAKEKFGIEVKHF